MKIIEHNFLSSELYNSRKVFILVPEDLSRRYPILYVHDGAYIFRKNTPQGTECLEIDKALESLKKDLIVVGIPAMEWEERTKEYSPFPWVGSANKYLPEGMEKGKQYVDFIIHTLMPWIEAFLPVMTDYGHNYMLGSSLGAQISLYASLAYPDYFSKIGLFSLATWGNKQAMDSYLQAHHPLKTTSYFVRVGGKEGIPRDLTELGECYPQISQDTVKMLNKFTAKPADFKINPEGRHKTLDWSKDISDFLTWLNL
ncbi:MAG: alpha/beta hydrolase-fold protein [Bacilli bacterium]|jgi:predicted alpha/beta superfamily hydrolase|nr:alpha/beta hydrolase-fold protein [Bacilli bacterium]